MARSDTTDGSETGVESERQRLAADARAMQAMQAKSIREMEAESPSAWKWAIRKEIWDHLTESKLARNPMPVHHRIPNHAGAEAAADRLADLPEFRSANTVKINPDSPQKRVRWHALSQAKLLLCPQPRLRTGFFSTMHRDSIPSQDLWRACSAAGVAEFGVPLSLDDALKRARAKSSDEPLTEALQQSLTLDAIVVGSTAVARNGARIGKGEGFAELEYGILRWMGLVTERTPVITTVHDDQILQDERMPTERLLEHDVPVDIIVTPTQVIHTHTKVRKPSGILWHLLSPQKLQQVRVLRELKARIEREEQVVLPTGPDELLPPPAARNRARPQGRRDRRGSRDLRNQGI